MPIIARSFNSRCLSIGIFTHRCAGLLGALVSLVIQCSALAESKVVQERYSNGGLRIQREVTLNADGNFVNDGLWRKWDPSGELVAKGHYAYGERVGAWVRWLNRDEADAFYPAPFDQFESPFVSRATFVDGQMDDEWTIADAHGRTCSRIALKNGSRNGPATLWLPDGRVLREAHFVNGLPSGELRELDAGGNLRLIATYVDGRQVVNNVALYPDSEVRHIEATCQAAVVTLRAPDDYAQLRFAQYAVSKRFARHGPWRSWYSNGQLQCEGNCENDREAGTFTWWHANGAPAVEGVVIDGLPDGSWTWWYANGRKAAEAQFTRGAVISEQPSNEQFGESPISASFTPKGRAAVTRKNRQLY